MSIKVEKTDNKNEVKLEFEIEAAKFLEGIKTVYTKNMKHFNIPGFRKGKVPIHMVEKHYGTEIFYEDAFNEIVPPIYDEAIKENNIEAVSKPKLDITQMEKGKDLVFTAIVQIKPEVTLGIYKSIEIKKIEYNVSDADVEQELASMQEKNSRLISIEDRAVEDKDITIIDFEGFIDGKPFEGGKAKSHELTIGSKTFIPGFEEQVVGMKIGEEKDIEVNFPDEYFSKELSGKKATFKVKLHEIKKKELPELDDEFVKDVSEFDTMKELKQSIKTKLEEESKSKEKYETQTSAVSAVVENATVDIPSGMIETELEDITKDIETKLSYQGMKLEDYLKMMGKSIEDFKKEHEEEAKKSVKTRLVLEAVSIDAKIEVPEEDMNNKLKEMAENYNKTEEELNKNEQLKQYVENNLKAEKTVEYIVNNAKIK